MAETFPCKQNKCQLQLNDVILGMGHLIDPYIHLLLLRDYIV